MMQRADSTVEVIKGPRRRKTKGQLNGPLIEMLENEERISGIDCGEKK